MIEPSDYVSTITIGEKIVEDWRTISTKEWLRNPPTALVGPARPPLIFPRTQNLADMIDAALAARGDEEGERAAKVAEDGPLENWIVDRSIRKVIAAAIRDGGKP